MLASEKRLKRPFVGLEAPPARPDHAAARPAPCVVVS